MDGLTTAAAAGLRARLEAMDMLANNIANAGTAGFKRDGEFYNLFLDAEAQASNGIDLGSLPVIEKHWTDFSQGTIESTCRPLDLALSGRGFFALNGPSGTLYTRNGSFRVTPQGTVASSEGYALRLTGGAALQVQPGEAIEVSHDGTVRQGGVVLGQLEIVDFPNGGLAKQGSTAFLAQAGTTAAPAAAEVHQGRLEASNVGSAESAVRLVSLLRQFETLQKAIGIGAEMNRKAVDEVARVGS